MSSRSPTSAALSNFDVLLEIFNRLAPFPDALTALPREVPPEMLSTEAALCRRTLLSAALTCKAFAEPASSVLWRVLPDGLLPLFCPLSAFKIVVEAERREVRSPKSPPRSERSHRSVARILDNGTRLFSQLIRRVGMSGDKGSVQMRARAHPQATQLRSTPIIPKSEHFPFVRGTRSYQLKHFRQEDVSPAEKERWKLCVSRVRYLVLRGTWTSSSFMILFLPFLLECVSAGEPILPSLQALAFEETFGAPARVHLVGTFLSPTVSEVMLLPHGGAQRYPLSANIWKDLKMISAASCDNIRRLTIRSAGGITCDLPIACFPRLRACTIRPCTWMDCGKSAIAQLRSLEGLETLDIGFWCSEGDSQPGAYHDIPSEDRSPERKRFSALRNLNVSGTLPQIVHVLSSIRSTSLENAEIYGRYHSDSFVDLPLTAIVKAFPWEQNRASLRRLHLDISPCWPPPRVDGEGHHNARMPFFDILAPLAHMHAIEALEIVSRCGLPSISDEAVAQMSAAWPRLQHLVVASGCPSGPDGYSWSPYTSDIVRPSLLALVRLAERCPSLTYCEIDVASMSEAELVALEAHVAERDVAIAAPGAAPQPRLTQLIPATYEHVNSLTLPDIDRLARALRALFPSLEGVGDLDPRASPQGPWRRASRAMYSREDRRQDAFRLLEKLNELAGKTGPWDPFWEADSVPATPV